MHFAASLALYFLSSCLFSSIYYPPLMVYILFSLSKLHMKTQKIKYMQKLQLPPGFCFPLGHRHEIMTVKPVKETQ